MDSQIYSSTSGHVPDILFYQGTEQAFLSKENVFVQYDRVEACQKTIGKLNGILLNGKRL